MLFNFLPAARTGLRGLYSWMAGVSLFFPGGACEKKGWFLNL
jgi:hypothetical protein